MARTPETDPPGLPACIEPMMAAADDGHLVDDPRFAYELKLDGYRAIMRVAPNPPGTSVHRVYSAKPG